MTEPKRLLEDGQVPGDMKALLQALDTPQAPSAGKALELGRQLVTASSLAATVPATLPWLKAALLGGALLAAGGGYWAMQRETAEPPRAPLAAPARRLDPAPAAPAAVEAAPAAPTPAPAAEPLPSKPTPSARASSAADTLADEELLLERARRLKDSSPGEALALLEQHRQRFPKGQLGAERLFLSVEVLERLGNKAASQRQAEALMRQYPRSVYATRLKAKSQALP